MAKDVVERQKEVQEEILRRITDGIPPCGKCGNTDPNKWSIDVFTHTYATEVCDVCQLRRPILEMGGVDVPGNTH